MPDERLKPPPAFPDMAVGLLGGTFDPPHEAHLHISAVALKRLGLDRLWWLVSPGNPLKQPDGMSPFAGRLDAADAFARHPRIDVTGFEAPTGSRYTADAIEFLLRRYRQTRFVWVMGADNLAGFHRWDRWRDIMEQVPVAVVDRPGYRFPARAGRAAQCFARAYVDESDAGALKFLYPPAWTLLTAPLSTLSSTELRAARGENESAARY